MSVGVRDPPNTYTFLNVGLAYYQAGRFAGGVPCVNPNAASVAVAAIVMTLPVIYWQFAQWQS